MDSKTTSNVKHGIREVRLEDDALVRGAGRFVDDARYPNQAFAAFLRSPHAHAKITSDRHRRCRQSQRRAGGASPART